jgi:hypothetical protein
MVEAAVTKTAQMMAIFIRVLRVVRWLVGKGCSFWEK